MLVNYLSLCLLGISACFLADTAEAIIGGKVANKSNEFPYQVSLQNDQFENVCGGGMINGELMLTAASCLLDSRNGHVVHRRLYAVVGAIKLYVAGQRRHNVTVQVVKAFVPRNYSHTNPRHDVAVLKLARQLIHPTRPRSLLWLRWPWLADFEDFSTGTIVGFGYDRYVIHRGPTSSMSQSGMTLKLAVSRVLSNAECQRAYPNMIIRSEYNFCARMEVTNPRADSRFGVCDGDQGSLLVHARDEEATVMGILSRISPNCDEKEGRGPPALYTQAVQYHSFVAHISAMDYSNAFVINYRR